MLGLMSSLNLTLSGCDTETYLIYKLISVSMNLTIPWTSYGWNYVVLSFCDWLVSLSMMSSRFITIGAYVRISFLRLSNIPPYIHTTLFIHLSIDSRLSYFHHLGFVNGAMNMNIEVEIFNFNKPKLFYNVTLI